MRFSDKHFEKLSDGTLFLFVSLTSDYHILRLAKSDICTLAGENISVADEKVSIVACFECARVKLTEHFSRVNCIGFESLIGGYGLVGKIEVHHT